MKTKIFKVSGYQFYFGNKPKSRQILEDEIIARHQRRDDIVLKPRTPDVFGSDTWFFRRIKVERADDRVVGLRVSNGRVRNLLFVKQK